jgi:hypothetical protein
LEKVYDPLEKVEVELVVPPVLFINV